MNLYHNTSLSSQILVTPFFEILQQKQKAVYHFYVMQLLLAKFEVTRFCLNSDEYNKWVWYCATVCWYLEADDNPEPAVDVKLATPAGGEGDQEPVRDHTHQVHKVQDAVPHTCSTQWSHIFTQNNFRLRLKLRLKLRIKLSWVSFQNSIQYFILNTIFITFSLCLWLNFTLNKLEWIKAKLVFKGGFCFYRSHTHSTVHCLCKKWRLLIFFF